ncbi:ABC-type multidrug transport system, ATPase component [mine drainage metagenome]
MAELLIEARNLSRYYGTRAAIQDVSLTLGRGEILGFLGLNGAGKSTTLRILSGALAPSTGRIAIAGIDLLNAPEEAKRKLGFLPEHPPLYPELTVDEYLRFCARIHGIPRKQVRAAVALAQEKTHLTDMSRRLIRNLSKGFQQRVGLAQAILHEPEVLLLDEPSIGLDPAQIQGIRDLIRTLGTRHSVIFSSHLLAEVQSLSTRVVIIHEGRLVLSQELAALDAAHACSIHRIGLRRPPALRALEALEGVLRVSALSEGSFRIEHADQPEFPEYLLREAVRREWVPYALSPERANLEEIFLSLTQGSDAADLPPGDHS